MVNRIDLTACEPFRAWNRLESRPRKSEFDRVLKVEINDPLWMLTRQWQFGEFKGEDTGSAIFAKVQIETTKITRFQNRDNLAIAYNDSAPLETRVERELFKFDYKLRMESGIQWLKYLDHNGNLYNESVPLIPYEKNTLKNIFVTTFPFEVPQIDMENDSNALIIEKSKLLSSTNAIQFLHAISGRTPDGVKIYKAFKNEGSPLATLPEEIDSQVNISHKDFILKAAAQFIEWFEKLYNTPENDSDTSWNESQLEYQFACALPNKNDDENTVLAANEYYHGKLDWHSFNIELDVKEETGLKKKIEGDDDFITTQVLTIIPSEARFPGMPNARWWEFEDGYMDLGNITAESTDIAKIILTEFALVYSNDWFIIPYVVPAGSFSEIKGIVVTDVFGQKTMVKPAGQGDANDWMSWTMFNLSKNRQTNENAKRDNRLLVPPSVPKIIEGEPVESVNFIRDEMANMVWGIETKIHDFLGNGGDGHTFAKGFLTYLKNLEKEKSVENESIAEPEENQISMLKYKLSNTVPENWIPFIPIHIGKQNRAIQLQRAAMPRLFNGAFKPVRARTDIMRYGMRKNERSEVMPFINEEYDIQVSPYYVNEEEVPRSGVIVTSSFQRARWYNGKTFTWLGRQKTVGRGEAASGLNYDILIDSAYENVEPLE